MNKLLEDGVVTTTLLILCQWLSYRWKITISFCLTHVNPHLVKPSSIWSVFQNLSITIFVFHVGFEVWFWAKKGRANELVILCSRSASASDLLLVSIQTTLLVDYTNHSSFREALFKLKILWRISSQLVTNFRYWDIHQAALSRTGNQFLLYLLSNYHQTWHDSTMAQNLSAAVKVKSKMTSLWRIWRHLCSVEYQQLLKTIHFQINDASLSFI